MYGSASSSSHVSKWQGSFGDDSSDLQTSVKEEKLDPAHEIYGSAEDSWDGTDVHRFAQKDSWNSWTSTGRSRGTRGRKRKEVHDMPTMEESIGMDLHASHPKTAVRDFLIRYFGEKIDRDDCYYVLQGDEAGFRAKLHVPIWSSDVFEGQQCSCEKEAESSAAQSFLRDRQVVEIAPRLPAPMKVVKYWVGNADCQRVYNQQREKGCRMAVWDGRA